jgi:hypothetical protein
MGLYPNHPGAPHLVIDIKESFMSRNYTWLGFPDINYQLPFYVNDLSLGKAVVKAIRPLP